MPSESAGKPAPKKPAVKRGPTKAQALKALGLTQADLDAIKAFSELKEKSSKVEEKAPELVKPVESKEAVFYARNIRNIDAGFRLSRQEKNKRRVELKPRGQRNDMFRLQKEDLDDPELINQIGYLIEIIPEAEAKDIMSKQNTNISQGFHPARDQLVGPLGKPVTQINVEDEYNSQGVVVARLDAQGGGAGSIPSQGRGIDWAAIKSGASSVQEQTSLGGNPAILSDGFADSAARQDAIARQKGLEGPAAGLGGAAVVVGETVKT